MPGPRSSNSKDSLFGKITDTTVEQPRAPSSIIELERSIEEHVKRIQELENKPKKEGSEKDSGELETLEKVLETLKTKLTEEYKLAAQEHSQILEKAMESIATILNTKRDAVDICVGGCPSELSGYFTKISFNSKEEAKKALVKIKHDCQDLDIQQGPKNYDTNLYLTNAAVTKFADRAKQSPQHGPR